MVEGQEGVGWDDWRGLARAAEEGGYDGLLRSDHYLSVGGGPDRGALDAWGTICALGPLTERIRLGTLVSPVTFRPAAVLAKLTLTADHASGGRIDVGIGAGWWQGEHEAFGFTLPPIKERMDLLERQLDDVQRFWRETGPPPVQQPRPHVIMGGQAKRRSAALAARYADEYNVLYLGPDAVREKAAAIAAACAAAGRDPLPMSMMIGFIVGADRAEVRDRTRQLMEYHGEEGDPGAWAAARAAESGWVVGTPEEVTEQLRALEAAGLQRVMLQHLLFGDLDVVRLIASDVLPAVAG